MIQNSVILSGQLNKIEMSIFLIRDDCFLWSFDFVMNRVNDRRQDEDRMRDEIFKIESFIFEEQ